MNSGWVRVCVLVREARGTQWKQKLMDHQSAESILGVPPVRQPPGSDLGDEGARDGGGVLCAMRIWVKDKYIPPSLLEVTNKPTHQRRIIKNNLHKLSVVGALF